MGHQTQKRSSGGWGALALWLSGAINAALAAFTLQTLWGLEAVKVQTGGHWVSAHLVDEATQDRQVSRRVRGEDVTCGVDARHWQNPTGEVHERIWEEEKHQHPSESNLSQLGDNTLFYLWIVWLQLSRTNYVDKVKDNDKYMTNYGGLISYAV